MPDKRQEFLDVQGLLEQMAEGIANQFGPNCEVLVHDLTDGLESTIVFIKNGHVSGRKVGDGASEIALKAVRDPSTPDKYCYITTSKAGRLLKSSTINIRGKSGSVIAVVSINFDISDFSMAAKAITDYIAADRDNSVDKKTIPDNVNDLLTQMIEEARANIGKPVALMTKDDKRDAIRALDKKGALLIRGSSERISEFFGISKYTLYGCLSDD